MYVRINVYVCICEMSVHACVYAECHSYRNWCNGAGKIDSMVVMVVMELVVIAVVIAVVVVVGKVWSENWQVNMAGSKYGRYVYSVGTSGSFIV